MIVPVSTAEMSRFVREFLKQIQRSVILAGAETVSLVLLLSAVRGLRIILWILLRGVCPLMGGWDS